MSLESGYRGNPEARRVLDRTVLAANRWLERMEFRSRNNLNMTNDEFRLMLALRDLVALHRREDP